MKLDKTIAEKYKKDIEDYSYRNAKYNLSRGLQREDVFALLAYVDTLKPNSIYVETGVADGTSLMLVALHRPDIECYGIDIQGSVRLNRVLEDYKPKNVHYIIDDATNIAKTWDKKIDLLFIDTGAHQFPQIFYDFAGWYPYVKPGSYILWHDYEGENKKHTGFDVGQAFVIFKGHQLYNCYIPAEEDNFSTSIAIIQKPYETV